MRRPALPSDGRRRFPEGEEQTGSHQAPGGPTERRSRTMKARPLLVGIALSAAILGGARLTQGRTAPAPSTGEPCPPAGRNCCLIRIHKRFSEGGRSARFVASYTC